MVATVKIVVLNFTASNFSNFYILMFTHSLVQSQSIASSMSQFHKATSVLVLQCSLGTEILLIARKMADEWSASAGSSTASC